MSPSVVVDNVEQQFGTTRALDGVTFDANVGVTGLLGPNGAGKTTLLRVLATVLKPDRGRVVISGLDATKTGQRLEIRRRLGYMPQEPGFHRNFTAFEFIDFVAILKEMTERQTRHAEVMRVLELTGLASVAGKKIKALSGGMRRRVALDEPTAGLDPEQRLRFREVISSFGETKAVLLSTHQTEDVAALCHHVIVLHQGSTLFEGTPRDLADVAAGRVWLSDDRPRDVRMSWRTAEGRHRNVGEPPPGADTIAPTIEDGYLLLLGVDALGEAA
jgi:ABC-2 type transport system ATP-binding protein